MKFWDNSVSSVFKNRCSFENVVYPEVLPVRWKSCILLNGTKAEVDENALCDRIK